MNRKKILIVDDEIDLLNLIDFNLTRKGYLTQSSLDGVGAFKKVNSFNPDLIVLDLMIPKIDGWKFCNWLKHKNNEFRHIPLLILSAKAEPADRTMGLVLGADDYMVKPFNIKELMIRVEKLLEKRREKDAFHDVLMMVSHEVNNKMQVINAMSEILHTKEHSMNDEKKKDFFRSIKEAALGTTELIAEIKTLVDVETGDPILGPARANIATIIADTVKPYKDAHCGIAFDIVAEGSFQELELNPVALKQVFANIIGNAVKYTKDNGKILILLRQEGRHVTVSVRDNGCGIPADELPKIFAKGYRASNAKRGFGGTGMGLYIVSLLVNKMGGKIAVKSEEGKGSEFAVSFPSPTNS